MVKMSAHQQWRQSIVTRATITIVTTAKTPAHQRGQHYHDEGNNASLMTSNEGNGASLTTAETPLHQ
jgi:hypothetical protein